ncbi:MAG: leucine-rich repeat domain-containing protein [Oscillospiraceae bacterium]|nr:leucine-rich repeat domain-containing protein [Oscillospiraceae bacterium]
MRIVALFITFTMAFALLPTVTLPANALGSGEYTSGDYGYSINKDGTVAIDQYFGSDENVIIPETLDGKRVTSMEYYVFMSCEGVKTVTIPESIKSIGIYAFGGCYSLTDIYVDENNLYYSSVDGNLFNKKRTTLINYASANSRTAYSIPESVTEIGVSAFQGSRILTEITIPESVTEIGVSAFRGSRNLTEITIPVGVKDIGYDAFTHCRRLTAINVDEKNPYYSSVDGNLFNKEKTRIIQYAIGNSRTVYSIPGGVEIIGEGSFLACDNLILVTMSNSVTSIEYGAFSDCDALESIIISESVTSIGDYSFFHCKSLISITIPESVKEIGVYSFYNCRSLSAMTFKSKAPPVFEILSFMPISVIIYVPVGTKEAYEAAVRIKEYTIIEGEGPKPKPPPPTVTCGSCNICKSGKPPVKGQILGNSEPQIFDFTEILQYLVYIPDCHIYKCVSALNAAILSKEGKAAGEPTIFCGVEILQYLVGLTDGKDW